MALRDNLLPVVDSLRGITDSLGFNRTQVFVLKRTWDGVRVGVGNSTTAETRLYVGGDKNPKVKEISARDIIASGGLYRAGDLQIGPLTPAYDGGGTLQSTLQPAYTSTPTEVLIKLVNSEAYATPIITEIIRLELQKPMRWLLVVRRTGRY